VRGAGEEVGEVLRIRGREGSEGVSQGGHMEGRGEWRGRGEGWQDAEGVRGGEGAGQSERARFWAGDRAGGRAG